MRHAILGAGGVGGLIGAGLAAAGNEVLVLVRAGSHHPPDLSLTRPGAHGVNVPVQVVEALDRAVDVLWIAVKATDLAGAVASLPDDPAAAIVPLLNGIDHVTALRARFGERVVPGTMRVEAERVAAGRIAQLSPFVRLELAAAGEGRLADPVAELRAFAVDCAFVADELTMLWSKLVFLAPFALATTAAAAPIGEVWADPAARARLEAAAREAGAVAAAAGATVDVTKLPFARLPRAMQSSMQRDVASGRPPELDAIAGPILRGGERHGIAVPATAALADEVRRRTAASAPRSAR